MKSTIRTVLTSVLPTRGQSVQSPTPPPHTGPLPFAGLVTPILDALLTDTSPTRQPE